MRLNAGPAGRSRILIKAKNNEKKDRRDLPYNIEERLFDSPAAKLQVFGSDLTDCFSVDLGQVTALRNDAQGVVMLTAR